MSGYPSSWVIAPIGEVTTECSQRVPADSEQFQYIDIGSIDRNRKTITSPEQLVGKDAPSRARKHVQVNDVLVSMTRPNLNAVALVPRILDGQIASTGFDVLRASGVDPRWLFYLVRSAAFVDRMSELVQGALYPAVRSKDIRAFDVPIAPIKEQKRIADKLDALLARVDACRDRLGRIPAVLKLFRQSVLAAATSGRLTENWRTSFDARITSQEVVEERRLHATKESGRKALESFLTTYAPAPGDGRGIPSSWVSANIGSIGVVSNGSTPSRKVAAYWGGDIPWISSGAVRNTVLSSARERITIDGYKNSSTRMLPKGTVLIAMIGEGKTRGQTALLDFVACINQNIAGVVPIETLVSSKYLWFWLQGHYENIRMVGNGTGPQALNCQRVRELPVNLPPMPEQTEIVYRIESLFNYADRLEAHFAIASRQIEKLTPAILAKAFRGQLVRQDPIDESANMLLQDICVQRAREITNKTER